MEENQNTQNPPITPTPVQPGGSVSINSTPEPIVPPTPPTAPPSGPGPKPVFKFDVLITNLKFKFAALPQRSKILFIAIPVVLIVLLLLLSLAVSMIRRGRTPTLGPTPTPIGSSPAPDVILNASRYATDEGVLKLGSDLTNIQKQLETTDIKQTDLSVPNLDFNIKFDQ